MECNFKKKHVWQNLSRVWIILRLPILSYVLSCFLFGALRAKLGAITTQTTCSIFTDKETSDLEINNTKVFFQFITKKKTSIKPLQIVVNFLKHVVNSHKSFKVLFMTRSIILNFCLKLQFSAFHFTTSLIQTAVGVKVITTLGLIGSTGLWPTIVLKVLKRWCLLGRSDFATDIRETRVTYFKILPYCRNLSSTSRTQKCWDMGSKPAG